jgi:hypothetical protein
VISPSPTPPIPKTSLVELQTILARGHEGDPSVLPQLRQVFDEHPELAPFLGDLVKHAEQALLNWIAGTSLTAKEALTRQVAELRTRLMATTHSELEKLLVDRICLSWLAVNHAEFELAHFLKEHPFYSKTVQAAEKRLGRAQARHVAAIRALATVQKLVRPAVSAVDLLRQPVAETVAPSPTRKPRERLAAALNAGRG